MSFDPQQARVGGIRAPWRRRSQKSIRGYGPKTAPPITLHSVGSSHCFQQGKLNKIPPLFRMLRCSRSSSLQFCAAHPMFRPSVSAQRLHHFGRLDTGLFPEEPRLRFVAQISELNEVFSRRLKQSPFPAGNRHGRALHSAGKFCLIDFETFPQFCDLRRPVPKRRPFYFVFHLPQFYVTTILR